MNSIAEELESILKVSGRLRAIDEKDASLLPGPGKWSKKEILGHLIDSAANNHQRFVRLQLGQRLELPGYEQEGWVSVQHYQDRAWPDVVAMWETYNRHLAFVIRHVDPTCLKNKWRTPDGQDVDLEFIMADYLVHMRHHLDQIV